MKYLLFSIKTLCLVLSLYTLYFILNTPIFAFEMNSAQYRIQMGNINMGGASDLASPGSGNLLSDTLGQLAANEFSSSGYIIKAGFQYWHSIVPFSFSISDININLGEIQPNDPKTATTNLTVSFGAAGNYQVTAIEQTKLTSLSGLDYIDDTNCDSGCDETSAGLWTSTSAYGFGYKMSGEDIPNTFTSCGSNCYRRFPDLSTSENPAVVMSSANVTVNLASKPKDIYHQSTVTFKVNIGPGQASGSYQTIINFLATPSY